MLEFLQRFFENLGITFGSTVVEFLYNLIYILPIVIISLTLHELFHALASHLLGDPTAKNEGRLTLNPLKHIDPLGFIMIVLFGFGWAKPVPVRLQWFEKPKRDFALTAAAGPAANLLLALFGVILYGIALALGELTKINAATLYFLSFSFYFIHINVGLALFNLIPVPPLDGSRIIMSFLPNRIYFNVLKYERVIMIALFILIALGIFDGPLNYLINTVASPLFALGSELGIFIIKIFS
ncbi:MAG: site-2 protease family protein [Clostridia bacterium]|nr:site-2 protease family protein [Clostridia bacterium]